MRDGFVCAAPSSTTKLRRMPFVAENSKLVGVATRLHYAAHRFIM